MASSTDAGATLISPFGDSFPTRGKPFGAAGGCPYDVAEMWCKRLNLWKDFTIME